MDYFYWNLANIAETGGQTNVAVKYYKKVITDVVGSGFAFESQIRLKELVETVYTQVEALYKDYAAGKLSKEEFMREVRRVVKAARYSKTGYFYAHAHDGVHE